MTESRSSRFPPAEERHKRPVKKNESLACRHPFVAISKFVVSNGMTEVVKRAFRERPHLVDDAPGFVRLDVISPIERPDEIWLITFWVDGPSFHAWHRSHLHKEAHHQIPIGLKLKKGETQLRFFEYVAS